MNLRNKIFFLLMILVLVVVIYKSMSVKTIYLQNQHSKSVPGGNSNTTTVNVDCKSITPIPIRQKQNITDDNKSGLMFYFDDPPVGNYEDIAVSFKGIGLMQSINGDRKLAVLLEGFSPSRKLVHDLRPDSIKLLGTSGDFLRADGGDKEFNTEQGFQAVRLFDLPSNSLKALNQMSVLLKYSSEPINSKYGPFDLNSFDRPVELNKKGLSVLGFNWATVNRPVGYVSSFMPSNGTPYDLRSPMSPDQLRYLVMQLYIEAANSSDRRLQYIVAHGSDGSQVVLVEKFIRDILSSSQAHERPPYLGFQAIPEVDGSTQGMQSVSNLCVTKVDPHGPAGKAGIRKGDVVLAIGEIRFDSQGVADPMGFARPGQSLPVQIERNGKQIDTTLVPDVDPLVKGLNLSNDSTKYLNKHFSNSNASALGSYVFVSKTAVPREFHPSHIDLYFEDESSSKSKPQLSAMEVIFKNILISDELRRGM